MEYSYLMVLQYDLSMVIASYKFFLVVQSAGTKKFFSINLQVACDPEEIPVIVQSSFEATQAITQEKPGFFLEKFSLENPICSEEITYQVGTTSSIDSVGEGSQIFELIVGESMVAVYPKNITSAVETFTFFIFTESGSTITATSMCSLSFNSSAS